MLAGPHRNTVSRPLRWSAEVFEAKKGWVHRRSTEFAVSVGDDGMTLGLSEMKSDEGCSDSAETSSRHFISRERCRNVMRSESRVYESKLEGGWSWLASWLLQFQHRCQKDIQLTSGLRKGQLPRREAMRCGTKRDSNSQRQKRKDEDWLHTTLYSKS
jgi:hypothetical protein